MLLFFLLQHLGYSTLLIKWQIFYKIQWSELRNCPFVLRLLGVKQYFGVLSNAARNLGGSSQTMPYCAFQSFSFLRGEYPWRQFVHLKKNNSLIGSFFFCTVFPLFLLFLVMTNTRPIRQGFSLSSRLRRIVVFYCYFYYLNHCLKYLILTKFVRHLR